MNRGHLDAMTNINQVRLVALGPHEALRAVPLTNTRLPSLDTPKVLDWLAEYKDRVIFVLPEAEIHAHGLGPIKDKPTYVADVEPQEYEHVLNLMPRADHG